MTPEEIKKLKKYGSAQLLKKLASTEGEELDTIKAILTQRGVEFDKKEAEDFRENVGKNCAFMPNKKTTACKGVIVGIMVDRRVDKTYYRIKVADKIYHSSINSNTLIIT